MRAQAEETHFKAQLPLLMLAPNIRKRCCEGSSRDRTRPKEVKRALNPITTSIAIKELRWEP